MSYHPSYLSYDKREEALQSHHFRCQCLLCEFERAHPEATRRRSSLLEEFDGIGNVSNIAMIPRLKSIVDELRKTYQVASTNTKKKEAITASTSVTSAFLPHQLKFGMMIPLISLSELLIADNQLRENQDRSWRSQEPEEART